MGPLLETRRRSFVFLLLCCAVVGVKFFLVQDQKLIALGDARYDSRLFIDLAQAISQGRWFGPYDERTLIKGPFYPLWIAAVHHLHVPLLSAQHSLYLAACAATAWALARPLGVWGAFFFFTVLWFNPTSYALHTGMVLREYVSTSLAMLVAALTLILFQAGTKRRMLCAMVLGICLGAFWLTREEAAWILPFYATAAVCGIFRQLLGCKNGRGDCPRNRYVVNSAQGEGNNSKEFLDPRFRGDDGRSDEEEKDSGKSDRGKGDDENTGDERSGGKKRGDGRSDEEERDSGKSDHGKGDDENKDGEKRNDGKSIEVHPPFWGRLLGNCLKHAALALVPLVILAACITLVAEFHRAHYGIAETVELKSRFFREAYGALTRVEPQVWRPAVPVPRDVRERLYAVSPSFRELRPHLERKDSVWTCTIDHLKRQYEAKALDDTSRKGIDFILENDASGVWRGIWNQAGTEPCDIYGPWFVWAFREAAAAAGHHRSALAARAYYERLAREIHEACDRKELPCGPARSSLAPPWKWEYARPWVTMFGRVLHLAVSLKGFQYEASASSGDAEALALFQAMTREKIMPVEKTPSRLEKTTRLEILEHTATLYGTVFPWVFYAALAVHLLLSFSRKAVLGPFWGFATAVLASCAALAALLAYVHVTSFPGIEPRYLAPLPPLSTLYVALVFLTARDFVRPQSADIGLDPSRTSC